MDVFALSLPADGMLGITSALKQAVQEAFFFLARTFWVSFLTLELYILKPLVLQTPVPTDFTFFTGHDAHIYYDPDISGPDGIIQEFYQKTSVMAGFVMTLGLVFSGFLLGMGIANDNWVAAAKDNLRRLIYTAPFIYLSIYLLQFVAELSAMFTSFFLDEDTYNDFLLELPQLIINPGTPKFSDEVGLIIGLALTSVILFMVLLELVARFAIMVFVPAISPILVALSIFHWSRPMAHATMRLYITAAFFQPVLAICLNFTLTLVLAMRSNSSGTVAPWAMLAGCAALMAYLPRVLSGAGNQLSQATQGIKTAAVATVATVAMSTGVGAAALGTTASGGAAALAGSRGGFGAATAATSRAGNWVHKIGERSASSGMQQLTNLGREASGMGGLTKLPHDDMGGMRASKAVPFPGMGPGKELPGAAAKGPLLATKSDRAAFAFGQQARATLAGKTAPQAASSLAGNSPNVAQLEAGLRDWTKAPADLKGAVKQAQANPALARRANDVLGAKDGAGFHAAYRAGLADPQLEANDQDGLRIIAGYAADGRGLPGRQYREGTATAPPSGIGGRLPALGADGAKLLVDAERNDEQPNSKTEADLAGRATSLASRAAFASAAATGNSAVAKSLALEPTGSAAVDSQVQDAARQIAALEGVLLGLQQAAHSTMRGASPASITSRQPGAVRESLTTLGRASSIPAVDPFLRQVEAGKYDAQSNKALDSYLETRPALLKEIEVGDARAEALTPQQAAAVLKRTPDTFENEGPRRVLTQIANGDQDNGSLRAYRSLQSDVAAGPAPVAADLGVVASFPRRMEEILLTESPASARGDVETALAAIRSEASGGVQRLRDEEARLAAEQAIAAAAHVESHLRKLRLK